MQADTPPLHLPDISIDHPTMESPDLYVTDRPRIEGYQILEPLGQGGMGTVWHAIQLGTHRKVALKLMSTGMFASDRSRHRFDREVELTARLDHPNIARIYDSGLDRGVYFYAMERVDGVPLDLYVETHAMSRRDILELTRTICQAVHHAHQRGVIHRDLKPGNILVDADAQPHVLDFGLAKTILHEKGAINISVEADLAGTPAYMSPEQATGHVDKLDIRTDVYSLGVILYRLLLKKSPHDLSGTSLEVLRRISENTIQSPRRVDKTVDRELEAILLKALARRPEDRYASAGELAFDLNNYLNNEPLIARRHSFAYVLGKQLYKYTLPLSLATAIMVILIAMAVFSYLRVRDARDIAQHQRDSAESLINFTIALARQPTTDAMLNMIVDSTMLRGQADAGTLFVRDGDALTFEIAKNKTLQSHQPNDSIAELFTKTSLPISQESIAGYVAATGRSLNISDAYHIPADVPYHFNSDFDRRTGYHSQSMLVVPLTDANNKVLGVLQLINRTTPDGEVVPFPAEEESVIHAMAQQAAIVLRYRAPRSAGARRPVPSKGPA